LCVRIAESVSSRREFMYCTHRRRDTTKQFRLFGVGGVYWALGDDDWRVATSVIAVQQFIFILIFIKFSVNHFYFYSVLVLSIFIYFCS